MPKTRLQKEEIRTEIADRLTKSAGVVLVNMQGVKVSEMEGIRDKLFEDGMHLQVAKNSLLRLVLAEQKIEIPAELLDQPISEPQMMPGSKTEAVPEANAMLLAGQGLCILLFATAAMRLRHVARLFTARLCDATSKSRRASPAAIGAYQHIERP